MALLNEIQINRSSDLEAKFTILVEHLKECSNKLKLAKLRKKLPTTANVLFRSILSHLLFSIIFSCSCSAMAAPSPGHARPWLRYRPRPAGRPPSALPWPCLARPSRGYIIVHAPSHGRAWPRCSPRAPAWTLCTPSRPLPSRA